MSFISDLVAEASVFPLDGLKNEASHVLEYVIATAVAEARNFLIGTRDYKRPTLSVRFIGGALAPHRLSYQAPRMALLDRFESEKREIPVYEPLRTIVSIGGVPSPLGILRTLGIWHGLRHHQTKLEKSYKEPSLVLVSHSIGGYAALDFHARFPHIVKATILLGTPVNPDKIPSALIRAATKYIFGINPARHPLLENVRRAIQDASIVKNTHVIVSESDPFCVPESCEIPGAPMRIFKKPTHIGLPFNDEVLDYIATVVINAHNESSRKPILRLVGNSRKRRAS